MNSPEIIDKMVHVIRTPLDPSWKIQIQNGSIKVNIVLAFITWLMYLDTNIRPICKRLRTPAIITNSGIKGQFAIKNIKKLVDQKPSQIADFFDTIPTHVLFILFHTINQADITEVIYKYISHWKKVKPITSGEDLQKLDIPPGPVYKEILARIRKAWLDEEIISVEQEQILLDEIITSKFKNEGSI